MSCIGARSVSIEDERAAMSTATLHGGLGIERRHAVGGLGH